MALWVVSLTVGQRQRSVYTSKPTTGDRPIASQSEPTVESANAVALG
jgi:hypothetical protein